MRRLLLLSTIIFLIVSCAKDTEAPTYQSFENEVKINLNLNLDFDLKLSGSDSKSGPNPGYNTEESFSEFEHVFADEIDLVFSSTTSDYTNTLTFNPNDLSTAPTLLIPYGSYTWVIEDNTPTNPMGDYILRDYLPVFATGTLEIASSSVVLDLKVDTEFGLVTVEKNLIESAKVINAEQYEKALVEKGDYLYLYVREGDGNEIEITETAYNTTIKRLIDDTGIVEAKMHYNYYLAISEVEVNSVSLESAPFGKKDYGITPGAVYLDENGVTVKAREDAEVGKSYLLNGESYLVVNEELLRQMVANDEDVTKVVTTKVTDMRDLFKNEAFNQNIGSWDVSNVSDMNATFYNSTFNQDISSWDVSGVTTMSQMFSGGIFNQNISSWDVSNVIRMDQMFSSNSQFNQDISSWDVNAVTSMERMFAGATSFNQDIGSWDVSNVTNMSSMFRNASVFNKSISSWDVSGVTTMQYMFYSAASFNQDIGNWDVSNVSDMRYMFGFSDFNQDISAWNVQYTLNMSYMFQNNTVFNQDLSSWNVLNVIDCDNFAAGATAYTLPKPNFTNCDPN